jgi:hypothetical protein
MIDTDKYEGHTEGPWMMGEYKGRPSIHAGNETFVRSIARGLNPSQTADHALLLDAPLLLAEVKRLREMLRIAENNIPRRIHWDCYVNALIEAGFEEGDDE